jgi:hypothetical protein
MKQTIQDIFYIAMDIIVILFGIAMIIFLIWNITNLIKNMPTKEEVEAKYLLKFNEQKLCTETLATSTIGSLPVKCLKYYNSRYVFPN